MWSGIRQDEADVGFDQEVIWRERSQETGCIPALLKMRCFGPWFQVSPHLWVGER